MGGRGSFNKESNMYGQNVTERYLGEKIVTVNCTEASLKRKQENDEVVTVQYVGVLFTVKARALTENRED
uniref:Uncharacterized protein n=1 Tax=viral metagenome TaxID=1070528 RepID=A0A6H1ZAZ0_9ZZZZ